MAYFKVTYEARGFTEDPTILEANCSGDEALKITEAAALHKTLPPQVQGIVSGHITADDGQDTQVTTVFVSVTVVMEVANEAQAEAAPPPEALLAQVADLMGIGATGEVALCIEEHSWEVTEVEPV